MTKPDIDAPAVYDGDLDLRSLRAALMRRKGWIIWPTFLVAVAAAISVNMISPWYKSEARIVYDGRENVFLRPEVEKPLTQERSPADPETLTDQVQIVLSRPLALEVIATLKLNENPEFDPVLRGSSLLRRILATLGLARDPLTMSPEERVLESWRDRLTVYAVDKSRVIVIEFASHDPALAASVTNAVAEAYLRLQQAARQEQTQAAGVWLAGEIDNLRRKVVEAEAKAEEFRSRTNLFVGPNNTSLSHQQLGEFNSQLVAARGQKADAETRARIIREMLQKGQPINASDVVNSELIRRLSEQRVTLRGQLAEQSSTLLDGHPRIKELKAQIANLDNQIRAEAEKLIHALENEARIAGARVEALSASLDTLKRQAASSNEEDVQFRALEREAKAQRDLLESYLARYRETTARESIGTAPPDARIISSAIASNTPYFPKKVPIVTVAALLSLMLSAGLVTAGELMRASAVPVRFGDPDEEAASSVGFNDPAERTRRAIAAARAASPLGPASFGPSGLSPSPLSTAEGKTGAPHPALGLALGAVSEVVARLRQNSATGRAVAVLSLASATTTLPALTLARGLAAGAKVVLVGLLPDAPILDAVTAAPSSPGLSEIVSGSVSFGEAIGRDKLSRVHLVGFGRSDLSLTAVLTSPRFAIMMEALQRAYDHIIIDAGRLDDERLQLAAIAPRCVLIVQEKDGPANGVLDRLAATGFADVAVMRGADMTNPANQRAAA
jgi:succinoglycan biosynthesis transport protein ExoP